MHIKFITYLKVTKLSLMSQVNSVKALGVKRAKRLVQNRDRIPFVDIKSSYYSKHRNKINNV